MTSHMSSLAVRAREDENLSEQDLQEIVSSGLLWELRQNDLLSEVQIEFVQEVSWEQIQKWCDGHTRLDRKTADCSLLFLTEEERLTPQSVENLAYSFQLSRPQSVKGGAWYANRIIKELKGLPGQNQFRIPAWIEELLARLHETRVLFVIAGGVGLNRLGIEIPTADLDICYEDSEPNKRLLLDVLGYPDAPTDFLDPEVVKIENKIDLMRRICGAGTYDLCRREAVLDRFGNKVLDLQAQMAVKSAASRPKDRLHLIELALLREVTTKNATHFGMDKLSNPKLSNIDRLTILIGEIRRLGRSQIDPEESLLSEIRSLWPTVGSSAMWSPEEKRALLSAGIR